MFQDDFFLAWHIIGKIPEARMGCLKRVNIGSRKGTKEREAMVKTLEWSKTPYRNHLLTSLQVKGK